jgi:hypothetical protein
MLNENLLQRLEAFLKPVTSFTEVTIGKSPGSGYSVRSSFTEGRGETLPEALQNFLNKVEQDKCSPARLH